MLPTLAEQYRRWFAYEVESHEQALASLESVPEAQRGSAQFAKALSIMGHVLAARLAWLFRLGGTAERPGPMFPGDATLAGLRDEAGRVQREWSAYLDRLDDAELARDFIYQSSDGGRFHNTVVDVLTQLYGHSLYHRGQIASLVRAAGGTPAETDFIYWSREPIAEGR